jgi:hypothetical protein
MTAASENDLKALHGLIAKSLSKRIQEDMDEDLPTDAATLATAIKFLKDNDITADPADSGQLDELRKKMVEQSEANKARQASNVLDLAKKLNTGTG